VYYVAVKTSILSMRRSGQRTTFIIETPDEQPQESYESKYIDDDGGMEFAQDSNCCSHSHEAEVHTPELKVQHLRDDLPVIVMDCANIGWAFGVDRFSADGVARMIQYLSQFEVSVIGFIPASYVRRRPKDGSRGNAMMVTEEWELLDGLVRSHQVDHSSYDLIRE
jgi:hypothetical protein